MPIGVKDIINTADFPTQMGSPLWNGFTPGNDARVVFNMKRAGGLVPGKTVTAEFAVHTLGKTINPWAPERTPGTSSSGSAVAVALGMVPAALGTQTAGSIVRPASFCGVWGMKPSFGLIPRTGMLKTTDSLDTVGFFAGHAADLQRLFDGLRVDGRDYPVSHRAFTDTARQSRAGTKPPLACRLRAPACVAARARPMRRHAMEAWVQQLAADPRFEVIEAGAARRDGRVPPAARHHLQPRARLLLQGRVQARPSSSRPVMNAIDRSRPGRSARESYASALERQVELARVMEQLARAAYDVMVTLSTAGPKRLCGTSRNGPIPR